MKPQFQNPLINQKHLTDQEVLETLEQSPWEVGFRILDMFEEEKPTLKCERPDLIALTKENR